MKKCSSCGIELNDTAKFCTYCGAPQQPQEIKCIQCGAHLQPGAKFCTECGAKQIVKKQFCVNCGAELKDGMKFCVKCGTKIQESSVDFLSAANAIPEKPIESETTTKLKEIIIDRNCNYKATHDDNNRYGFVDGDGKWVIEPKYDMAYDFHCGLAAVAVGKKYGYIKSDGTYLIEPKFNYADDFIDGFALVQSGSDYGYIKPDGTYLVTPRFEAADRFCEGLACVRRKGKYDYITKKGFYLGDRNFERAESFSEGYACVKINGKYGYIKPDGTYFIEPMFDYADSFKDGEAEIEILNYKSRFIYETNGGVLYLDKTIEFNNGEKTDVDDLFNKLSNAQHEEENDSADESRNSCEEKKESTGRRLYPFMDTDDGKWGYKDQNGDIALLARFDEADDFVGDYARVVLCGNVLYIDKKGHLCEDRSGNEVVIPEPNESDDNDYDNDYSYDDSDDYRPKKSFSRMLVGAVVKGIKNAASSSSSSSSSRTTSRNIRKVWRCTYIGTINDAPRVLDVPSENSTGRPSGSEFVAALKAMGYSDSRAQAIAAGGGNHAWKCQ